MSGPSSLSLPEDSCSSSTSERTWTLFENERCWQFFIWEQFQNRHCNIKIQASLVSTLPLQLTLHWIWRFYTNPTFASVVWDTLPCLLFTSTMIGSEASRNLCTASSWLHWDTSTPFTWEWSKVRRGKTATGVFDPCIMMSFYDVLPICYSVV